MAAFAAQSTVDVPVSAKQKDSALQELLGANVNKMQRDEEYVIGHGDILSIALYEEGDMSATAALKTARRWCRRTQSGIHGDDGWPDIAERYRRC